MRRAGRVRFPILDPPVQTFAGIDCLNGERISNEKRETKKKRWYGKKKTGASRAKSDAQGGSEAFAALINIRTLGACSA